MRIVYVVNALVRAGAELFVVRLSGALVKLGHEVDIVSIRNGDDLVAKEARAVGLGIYILSESSVYDPRCILRLGRFLACHKYDVIHTHMFPALYWVAAVCWGSLRPKVLLTTEHSTFNRRREFRLLRWVEALVYRTYNAVVCISAATQRSLVDWLPSIAAHTVVLTNGIALQDIQAAIATPVHEFAGLSKPIILSVGRLHLEKGQDLLIGALRHLPNASLVLVGNGPRLRDWQELSTSLGVDKRIRFLGSSTRVYSLMKACDVYVQPSRWEGFGIAALEAMACGAKIVAADVPGLRDVVAPYGTLFAPGDIDALARAISDALHSPREDQASLASVEWEEYSIQNVALRHEALYRSLINKDQET